MHVNSTFCTGDKKKSAHRRKIARSAHKRNIARSAHRKLARSAQRRKIARSAHRKLARSAPGECSKECPVCGQRIPNIFSAHVSQCEHEKADTEVCSVIHNTATVPECQMEGYGKKVKKTCKAAM